MLTKSEVIRREKEREISTLTGKWREGQSPFNFPERESFEQTHQARKSLFKYCLVAALLLRALRAGGEAGGGD